MQELLTRSVESYGRAQGGEVKYLAAMLAWLLVIEVIWAVTR
jgi:hypothetical protein